VFEPNETINVVSDRTQVLNSGVLCC